MDGGMEADAMRALDEVTSIGAVVSRPAGQRAVGTDGVGDEGRRAEEEISTSFYTSSRFNVTCNS